VLDGGEGHDAHIQRMTVQRIRRDDESGPLFVEREKANLASLGKPTRRGGRSFERASAFCVTEPRPQGAVNLLRV